MNSCIRIIDNPRIEIAKGFYSNGVHCGLKKDAGLDLGVVYSEKKADSFAVYTTNKVKGAPLLVAMDHLRDNKAQAVVVNSKFANTCTGAQGIRNSQIVCEETGKEFNIAPEDVIPMSTGVIGEQLPIEKITRGLKGFKERIFEENENNFSKAIMTTDTYNKIKGVEVSIGGKTFSIIGTAKGSGMIHPNMATMLAFIFTDADIKADLLKKSFDSSVDRSFNSISVDGDTSTNDTAIILANGMSGSIIDNEKSDEYKIFYEALQYVMTELSKEIVKDGEGATKLIEINVNGASSLSDAKNIGMSVANSSLVKTAFFGEDPNWGRILCAVGYSNADFDPDKVSLSIGSLKLYEKGEKTNFLEDEAKKILQNREIKVNIEICSGDKNWTVWTSDLSHEYININTNYRT